MGKCKKCGAKTNGTFTLCYACSQKLKKNDFVNYGRHSCKNCSTQIPKNKSLCFPCFAKKFKKWFGM